MFKKILRFLYSRRDKERYAVIRKRWELEKLKKEVERMKDEIYDQRT